MAKRPTRKSDKRPAQAHASVRALLQRAMDAEQRGEAVAAAKLYADALRAAPDDPDALHLAGVHARRRHKHADALRLLERATQVRPEDPRHHIALGITASEMDDRDAAVRSFERAVALGPTLVEAHFNLAAAHEDNGELMKAEQSYQKAVALQPKLAAAHYNLGGVLLALGRPSQAAESLRAAIALKPDFPKALSNLGIAVRDADPSRTGLEEAVDWQQQALALDDTLVPAWSNLGLALKELGRNDEALVAFRRAAALDPGHPTASHMVAALTAQTTARPPDGYVAQLFDGYAEKFDAALLDGLGYEVPRRIAQLIEERFGDRQFRNAIDLGCGTGLMGVELRPRAGRMIAVDLSPKMIQKAAARGIYDATAVGDIEATLRASEERFDLMVAADVLVYLGDLASLFEAVSSRLEPGGVFAFTTERAGEVDYVLRDTCRYAHGRGYLDELARAHDMRVDAERDVVLRQQHGEPVHGTLSCLIRHAG